MYDKIAIEQVKKNIKVKSKDKYGEREDEKVFDWVNMLLFILLIVVIILFFIT
jgi:hypothetical protein